MRAPIEKRTYRELAYLLTAAPLAVLWFGLLLAGWLAAGLLAVTPLVVPVLIAFRRLTWLGASLEAVLAHELLGVDVRVPRPAPGPKGYWGRIRGTLGDARFWREQAFLFLRMAVGGAVAIAVVSWIAAAGGALATPITYRWTDQSFGSWHVDTLSRALLFLPAGVVGLVVAPYLVRALAAPWRRLAVTVFEGGGASAERREPAAAAAFGRALPAHAAGFAGLNALLTLIWALTTRGYYWPEWTLLPLGLLLAIHAAVVVALRRTRGRALGLAIHGAVAGLLSLFLVGVWAVTTRGYFWPMWPMLGLGLVLAVHWGVVAAGRRDRAALTERIDVLTTTRAGAVDAAEAELSRIERDLHDGAQARLVALGMSIGMAEQKLATDPEEASRLLAEARAGAGEALKELRALARGIHPPVLTDRGLLAAVQALVVRTPLPVDVAVDVPERPPATVEAAAYFVVAEALANAVKHADASRVGIRIAREADRLVVEVADDGRGGARPDGHGLSGIRRRVEALDGTLAVTSPPGGPTTVKAVLPCAS